MSFRIIPSESIFTSTKFVELVDSKVAEAMLDSKCLRNNEEYRETETMTRFHANLDNDHLRVRYTFAKGGDTVGRVYPEHGLSLAFLRSKIRNTLAKGYVDIDMVNAHPTIALNICEKRGMDVPTLRYYVENREQALKDVMSERGVERKEAKNTFIKVMFGGNLDARERSKVLLGFKADVDKITDAVCESNPDYVKKYSHCDNPRATVVAFLFQDLERQILETVFESLVEQGAIPKIGERYNAVLCADGIMIPDSPGVASVVDRTMLDIVERTGFQIPLESKSMEDRYTREEIAEPADIDASNLFFDTFSRSRFSVLCREDVPDELASLQDTKEIEAMREKLCSEAYGKMKVYFEKTHFLCDDPPMIVRTDSTGGFTYFTQSEAKGLYSMYTVPFAKKKTSFLQMWLHDVGIRSHTAIDFCPPPMRCQRGAMNSFVPFVAHAEAMTVEPELHSRICEHVQSLADYDEASFEYLLNWMAHLVQFPGRKMGVAIVIKSAPGVGKNLFFEMFGEMLLGKRYSMTTGDIGDIVGTFPTYLNKLLVIMDETKGRDTFSNSDKLKECITATRSMWNIKGLRQREVNNLANFLFFTNNETPVKIEPGDRRYFAIQASSAHKGDGDYFKELARTMCNPEIAAQFYRFLLERDLSRWNASGDRPMTSLFKALREHSAPTIYRFLVEWLELNRDPSPLEPKEPMKVRITDFYAEYRAWSERCGLVPVSKNMMGTWVSSVVGIERRYLREEGRRYHNYVIDVDTVFENSPYKPWEE